MARAPKNRKPASPAAPPRVSNLARSPVRGGLWMAVLGALVLAGGIRLGATPGARRWWYQRQSIPALQATAERRPGDPVLRETLGRKLLAAGRVPEAVEELRRAAVLAPDSPEALAGFGRALATAGQDDDAFAALQLSVVKRPTAEALAAQGRLYLSHQVPEKAIPVLEQATRRAPDDPEPWRLLAEARGAAGQWSAAETAWGHAIALRPDDLNARSGRAEALIQLGRADEAEVLLRAVLRQGPRSSPALAGLGAALAARQPTAAFSAPAEAAFRESLRLDAANAEAVYGLALLLLRERRAPEAVPLLDDLLRRHPEALRARFQSARALRAIGRAAVADRAMEEYHRRAEAARLEMELRGRLTLRPNDPALRARLARLLRGTGRSPR